LVAFDDGGSETLFAWLEPHLKLATWNDLAWLLEWLQTFGRNGPDEWEYAWQTLTLLRDRRYDIGDKKRASVTAMVDDGLRGLFNRVPGGQRIDWATRRSLREPNWEQAVLVIDTLEFPAEGEESAARWIARVVELGWRSIVAYNWRGGRFAACGLGPESQGVRLDLYGDVGDYAGSGLDGCEVHLHGDGQDQVGQILKRGKLVIYGDVGQTFLYGAKGGEIYVLGSAAGRPLINAAGKPRAVINGTCLDYLAESFMAGDPLQGGGFVILNGMTFDENGELGELDSPYAGGNLFSLASGGAIYLRDPHHKVDEEQLNGGSFAELSPADWSLIEPYLKENERLFGICVEDLLTVGGERRSPESVYRKVEVAFSGVLQAG
jgi:formylmethanofuran dehydrogenase subunit C